MPLYVLCVFSVLCGSVVRTPTTSAAFAVKALPRLVVGHKIGFSKLIDHGRLVGLAGLHLAVVHEVIGAKPETRISLTYRTLESSRHTAFLVAGSDKREMLPR